MESMNDGTEVTAEYLHQAVHEGKLWEFYYENLSLPAGPTYFLLKTGKIPLHIIINLEGTGRIKVDTHTAPTISADGTPIVPGNYNAYRPGSILTSVYHGPTVTNEGALRISKTIFGSTQGNSTLSSYLNPGIERVWPPDSVYLLKVTTVDNEPWFRLTINCYEENT